MATKLRIQVLSTLIASFFVVAKSEVSSPPHILFVVADDLGWSDVSFHGSKIQTPNIDKLASEGVILDNYYVLPMCTPTRSALMTGRYPIHTGMQHFVLLPVSSYGMPLNFTILPQKLREGGYSTHMVGKWHLGFNKWSYTPTYRGFDSFYGFYNAAADYYTHKLMGILDFRDNEEPVRNLEGQYTTFALAKRAEEIIRAHKPSKPLFLYLAFQNVHLPIQVPKQYPDKYVDIIKDETRRNHAGMVNIMDEALGNVTEAMKEAGLWDDTLLVFTTDNGGIHDGGGYNWPLRGEKTTLWEGGVRGVSFVHGNMLDRKGVTCKDLLHVTDWYPTLVNLAGGTVDDDPSPLDGMNVWKTVSRGDPSPRTEILLNIDVHPTGELGFSFYEGIGLRSGDMKLLMGVNNDTWFKPPEEGGHPVTTRDRISENEVLKEWKPSKITGIIPVALYNVTADPEERKDLSDKLPTVVKALQKRVEYYMKGVVPSLYGPVDQRALRKALREGVWTPWQD